MPDPNIDPRRKNESEFVKDIQKKDVVYVPGFPPIRPHSNRDADHVDIIRDMRAMGYFDDEDDRY